MISVRKEEHKLNIRTKPTTSALARHRRKKEFDICKAIVNIIIHKLQQRCETTEIQKTGFPN